jgi:hypothetical protein
VAADGLMPAAAPFQFNDTPSGGPFGSVGLEGTRNSSDAQAPRSTCLQRSLQNGR